MYSRSQCTAVFPICKCCLSANFFTRSCPRFSHLRSGAGFTGLKPGASTFDYDITYAAINNPPGDLAFHLPGDNLITVRCGLTQGQ